MPRKNDTEKGMSEEMKVQHDSEGSENDIDKRMCEISSTKEVQEIKKDFNGKVVKLSNPQSNLINLEKKESKPQNRKRTNVDIGFQTFIGTNVPFVLREAGKVIKWASVLAFNGIALSAKIVRANPTIATAIGAVTVPTFLYKLGGIEILKKAAEPVVNKVLGIKAMSKDQLFEALEEDVTKLTEKIYQESYKEENAPTIENINKIYDYLKKLSLEMRLEASFKQRLPSGDFSGNYDSKIYIKQGDIPNLLEENNIGEKSRKAIEVA